MQLKIKEASHMIGDLGEKEYRSILYTVNGRGMQSKKLREKLR